ncbi:MAG: GNAT family N-acetyltransferase [Oscillospiraceae bacterium]|nr:GNAT family N-acetyltransferase [Oscillospiraceae bacterium]
MQYVCLQSERDQDVPYLLSVHKLPEIARFIGINEKNYFHYVTTTENVFYFKAYRGGKLAATAHCELIGGVLYLSLLVIPEFQRQGIGTEILREMQGGVFPLTFERIEVSIEKSNTASLGLFHKMGFTQVAEDEELMDFVWPT